jgi:L-malate glycosyltransferase
MTTIHQLLHSLVYGDAISNHAIALQRTLRRLGYKSAIYAINVDPRYRSLAQNYLAFDDRKNQTLIFHYSTGADLVRFAKGLRYTTVVPYYHNITPGEFFASINPQIAREMQEGREALGSLRDAHLAIAGSEYNRDELIAAGFANVRIVPYFTNLSRFQAGAASPGKTSRSPESRKLLFVGRIAPNKCQHDLVYLVRYYRDLINENVMVRLVGSPFGGNAYQVQLEALVGRLGLERHVEFLGHVSDEQLADLYRDSDVFVSMSEHEGFCVPLIEAMHFGLPIVAFASSNIPYTLGSAGILAKSKRHDQIGEIIERLCIDIRLREAIIAGQHRQALKFAPEVVTAMFTDLLPNLQEHTA